MTNSFTILILALAATVSVASLDELWSSGSYGKSSQVTVMKAPSSGGSVVNGRPFELVYLTMRGLAELPRLILEESGLPYIGSYYGREQFKVLKPTFPLGRVPVLRGNNGEVIAQSSSIVRYLARKTSLDGKDEAERAQVDMWYETYKELFQSHAKWGKALDIESLKNGNSGEETVLNFRDMSNGGEYSGYQKSMAVMTTFEEALSKNKSGFLVGDSLTYVDLALWSSLLELEEEDNMPNWADMLKLPSLDAFKKRVEQRENIQAYLQSDRLMPRIKKVDGDYQYVKGFYSAPKAEEVEVVMN